jgi:hypothetical protein
MLLPPFKVIIRNLLMLKLIKKEVGKCHYFKNSNRFEYTVIILSFLFYCLMTRLYKT